LISPGLNGNPFDGVGRNGIIHRHGRHRTARRDVVLDIVPGLEGVTRLTTEIYSPCRRLFFPITAARTGVYLLLGVTSRSRYTGVDVSSRRILHVHLRDVENCRDRRSWCLKRSWHCRYWHLRLKRYLRSSLLGDNRSWCGNVSTCCLIFISQAEPDAQ
jgi:hypothetical protein